MNERSKINVDSLLMRLSLNPELIQLNEKSGLNDKYQITNISTGETKDHTPKEHKKPLLINGIKYKIWTRYRQINGITNRYLYVAIHSHQLKDKYLEGITLNNVEMLYNELMKLNIFKCSFETFLNKSHCTDIDFKQDKALTKEEYTQLKKQLRAMTKTQKTNKGYKNYQGGICWNTLRGATIKNPFVKIYDKELQLNLKCEEFKNMYLKDEDFKDMKRLEFTVKDAKHLKRLGIGETQTSLKAILSLSTKEKNDMKSKILNEILDLNTIIKENTETNVDKLNGNDIAIYNAINQLIDITRLGYKEIIEMLSDNQPRTTKYNFIRKWEDRYNLFEVKYDYNKALISEFLKTH